MYRNAYPLLVLTTLFWGGNTIAGKLAVGHISPMMLTGLRWVVALAILLAIGWSQFKKDWPVVRRHLPLMVPLGMVGFTFFNAAMYSGLQYTSAVNSSIEQAGIPAVTMVANFLFFAMRVSLAQFAGFLLTLLGIAITAAHGDLSRLAELDVNIGDFLTILAVLFYAGYTVLLRYKPDIHWQSTMIVFGGSALVASVPFVIWEIAADRAVFPDTTGWAIGLYTVLFPSLLAQIFYMRGVELIGPNRASLFINLIPVFGAVLSVVLLGEQVFAYHAVAFALVLAGIALAEWSGRRMAAAGR
jgi:drug/metabolite transporter (DMT)-like permease